MKSFVVPVLMLFLSPVAGLAQWTAVSNPTDDAIELFLSGDRLYAGSTFGRVYGSYDHGTSWSVVGTGLEIDYAPVVSLVRVGDYLLMSRSIVADKNLRCFFDGNDWLEWTPLEYQDAEIRSFAIIGEAVFALLGGDLHRSDDFGATWTPVAEPDGNTSEIFAAGGSLFASNQIINGGTIHRSDDLGMNWTEVGGSLNSSYVISHTIFEGALYLSVYNNGGLGTIYSSMDLGDSWSEVTGLPTSYNINGMALTAAGIAIGASGANPQGQTIFVSGDFQDWDDYTGDLPQFARPVAELISHDGWFFKTGGSVTEYRAPHPLTSSAGDRSPGQAGLALTAFPNPFQGSSTLRYGLTTAGTVRLTVHDAAGRLVRSLDAGHRTAGLHTATWDGRSGDGTPVSSGIFFITLDAGGETARTRVLLIR